ncbi:MAG TPA: YncE family protein [Romboutsia timonensis]|uniref:YncE family protein n=1 Tax=Romboutsia timonensis TaxID=1776391 RepID=A0A921SZH1_9FIRM|nr:YncE family protein [Romboutsia timonensis]
MKVYISNYLSRSISIIDYSTLELEMNVQLDENIYPHNFCIDKIQQLAYIPSSLDGELYVLDLSTGKIIDDISIGGKLSNIALCNEELFISNEDSNSIYVLDLKTLNPIGIIGVDNMPHGFDIDYINNKLYVACIDSIICIDTISKMICKKIDIDFKAMHVKLDRNKNEIYTSTLDGKVLIIDEENLKIKKIIDKFLVPVEICFNYKSKQIYVADMGHKKVIVLDYDTGEILDYINIDGNPQGLQISNDYELLFISDTKNNLIKIYNTLDNILLKDIKVGKEPTTIICM